MNNNKNEKIKGVTDIKNSKFVDRQNNFPLVVILKADIHFQFPVLSISFEVSPL